MIKVVAPASSAEGLCLHIDLCCDEANRRAAVDVGSIMEDSNW